MWIRDFPTVGERSNVDVYRFTQSLESMHKAAFLGPKAENATEFEQLLQEVLRDHAFWRRNIHPSDPRMIDEQDRQSDDYLATSARMRDELYKILAELKRNAPLYSPRQIGHMVSDPSIPALVGYFAGMLYNQNNVVAEAAPETVRKEHAYIGALARMIGYPAVVPETITPEERRRCTKYSWGHLASGGTSANLEALWVMRNVHFYPLAVRLLAAENETFAEFGEMEVDAREGVQARLKDLSAFEMQNLSVESVTELHRSIRERLGAADRQLQRRFEAELPSVRKAGLAGFLEQYREAFPNDTCKLPRVYLSTTAHYGWKKAADAVGLGVNTVSLISTDSFIRLDVDRLEETIRRDQSIGHAALGIISIVGTTEEGAVDPVHKVEALRERLASDGISTWHHLDAAFGGFLASMVPRDEEGRALPASSSDPTVRRLIDDLVGEEVYEAFVAMNRANSITIDPHKLGFVPYPAGAVLFRDYRVRDAISYAAPYLPTEESAGFSGFLGQWTLEGSRPGAAAVSCYLAQEALPLTPEGHGKLVMDSIAVNRAIVEALAFRFDAQDASWLTFRPFAFPDSIGFCFLLEPHFGIESVDDLNRFTRAVWRHLTVDGRENVSDYEFILSKTEVEIGPYRHVLENVIPGIDLSRVDDGDTVMLLRVFIMNPFVADWNREEPSFSQVFADHLFDVARKVYPEHVLRRERRKSGRRPSLRVVAGDLSERIIERLLNDNRVDDHVEILSFAGTAELDDIFLVTPDTVDSIAHIPDRTILYDPEGWTTADPGLTRLHDLEASTLLTTIARALSRAEDASPA
jgi:glutamate/tyrosine decarboxylase-like PLP-dependent enzyme